MADSSVAVTPGAGADVDTRTMADGNHRQVVAIGDPDTNANVAKVSSNGAVLMQGYQSGTTTGTITANGQTVGPIDVANYNIATVAIRGTYAGLNVTFEASIDGTNWFSVLAARTDTFTAASSSGVITSNSSWSYDVPLGAFNFFRIRATAFTSGTANVAIAAQSMPYEPCPTVGVSGSVTVTGSVTANQGTLTAASPLNINSAATTNATVVKASAGSIYHLHVFNNGAAPVYVKFYNKTTAPTVGTDVPVMVYPVAAGAVLNVPVAPIGHRFATGIGLAITGGAADSDTTAVAASQVKVALAFI